MKRLNKPIPSNSRGKQVADLHEIMLAYGFKVAEKEISGQFYGKSTKNVIKHFQEQFSGELEITGEVDESTLKKINALISKEKDKDEDNEKDKDDNGRKSGAKNEMHKVFGTVYDEWIEPMPNLPVTIFDKDIRSEYPLGEGKTDKKGNYAITYSKNKLARSDKGGANILVRIYGVDCDPLYTSQVYYDAAAQLKVDIDLGPRPYLGPSEFIKVLEQVKQFTGKFSIDELTENSEVHDLSFLIRRTGIAVNKLLQLVASFKFEKGTGLQAEVYYGILAQVGISSVGADSNTLPGNVAATIEQAYINLWNLSISKMIAMLQQAALKNTVTYKLWAKKDFIQTKLQKLKNAPPQMLGGTVTLPVVYNKLTMAGLNTAQTQVFLENYQPQNISPSFWIAFSKNQEFSNQAGQAVLDKLQTVFQLSAWTSDNTDLVSFIMNQEKINSLNDFSSLVSRDVSDWVSFIQQSGTIQAGTTDAVKRMAANIASGIEKIYPTQVFAARFQKNTSLTLSNRDYITGVITSSDFDILKSSIGSFLDTYIQKNPLPPNADQKTITYQMMGMQRVYKAAQSADASLSLLSNNIHSARQIYAMGKSNFVNQYSTSLGNADTASTIFDQAAQIHAGAAFLTGHLISRVNNPSTNMMTDYNTQLQNSRFINEYPDLANLFGMAASYCTCADCQSFLGIPAYLTDLLDYLYQRKTASGSNARALLQANNYTLGTLKWRRRPDIGDIDLNCTNTNTELPYIDIVNELLEDYIIPPISAILLKLQGKNIDTIYIEFLLWIIIVMAPGTINPILYGLLMKIGSDPKTPICNISLLTNQAVVSEIFFSDGENYPAWMMGGSAWIAQWIVRDQFITLKISLLINPRSMYELKTIFGNDLINAKAENLITKPDSEAFRKLSAVITQDVYAGYINEGNGGNPNPNPGGNGNGGDLTQYFALIVQEIHETHLSSDDISANPEYTNTNVYNSIADPFDQLGNNKWKLFPTLIPLSLPFDLYFTEANTFLEKMGKQRYDLMTTFRKLGSASIPGIVIAYMGLSTGDADIILIPRVKTGSGPDPQLRFWGSLDKKQPEVDLFLQATGLNFAQLQTLLTLSFINPKGDSYIAGKAPKVDGPQPTVDDICNTALMVITNMTSEKFDHVNRFLRLWNKLNLFSTLSMKELDNCIMSQALGKGSLNLPFAEYMFYFLQLMKQMNLSATQILTFYQNIDTSLDNNLYQQLFQNRQISNPLVAAFNLPLGGTAGIMDTQTNPGAVPVILTACSITQEDLTTIMGMNNGEYSLLTLENLTFIYACGLLSNALSISVSDLFKFTSLLDFNPLHQILPLPAKAADPVNTFTFIAKYNEISQAGFVVDDMNYILTNQSSASPSLIPNATTVVNGLESIRTALQSAVTTTTVVPDPKGTLLTKWLADPDLNWDKNIAAKVLSILANTDDSTYTDQVQSNLHLLQLLRTHYGTSSVTTYLNSLPPISFPDSTIANIQYDNSNYYLFFKGTMSQADNNYLNQLPLIDAAGQAAIQNLYLQSQLCPIAAVPVTGAAIPTWITSNQTAISQNVPGFTCNKGVLGFKGAMTAPVYSSLIAQSTDPTYSCALTQLLIATQQTSSVAVTFVQLSTLPSIALPDTAAASLTYSSSDQTLSFTGVMSAADCYALLGLSKDTSFQAAICQLFITALPGQTVSTPLLSLPAGWSMLPDISSISGLSASADVISFTGQMSSGVQNALSALSNLNNWGSDITALFNLSQSTVITTVPIVALPAGITDILFNPYGVTNTTPGGQITPILLSYTGVMSNYILEGLLGLSSDSSWETTITSLYQNSQAASTTSVTLPQPGDLNPSLLAAYKVNYSASGPNMTLSFTGQMQPQVQSDLILLSADATYASAINSIFNQTSAIFGISLPPINIPLTNTGLGSTAYTNGAIVFQGTPNAACNDSFNLQQLNQDPLYTNAINFIYSQPPLPSGTVAVALTSVPTISFPASNNISWESGQLYYTGQMPETDLNTFLGLSSVSSYQAAINQLFNQSQITSITEVPALMGGGFPDGVALSDLKTNGVTVQFYDKTYVLSFTGQMTSAQQNALLALVPPATNDNYTKAIQTLYTDSQTLVINTTPLSSLPPITIPPPVSAVGWAYDPTNNILHYSGTLPIPSGDITLINSVQTTNPDFGNAIHLLSLLTANPGNIMVYAPPPIIPFASSGIVLTTGDNISYVGGNLAFTGPMSFADYIGLLSLSADPVYQGTVSNVYIATQSSASNVTVNSTNYFNLPKISFPGIYANQLSYNSASSTLTLRGYITKADVTVLNSMGNGFEYEQALNAVYNSVTIADTGIGNAFLQLYESLLSGTVTALPIPDRYAYFLNAISAEYQKLKETDALTAQMASNFGVTNAVGAVLAGLVYNDFTVPAFIGNTKAINPDPDQFSLAQWFMKLTRMAFLINHFNLSASDIAWLLQNGTSINVLDITAWPTLAAPLSFQAWEVLNNLSIFQHQYKPLSIADVTNPGQDIQLSVYTIISSAMTIEKDITNLPKIVCNPGALLNELTLLTGWNTVELLYLLNIGQSHLPNLILNPLKLPDSGIPPVGSIPSLSDISILLRLSGCFIAAGQLKVVPSRCVSWVTNPLTDTIAIDIKQALKSIYPDNSSWMSAIQPLMNTLRQERRDALLEYLESNTVQNPFGNFDIFPDEFTVYGNFLIDVKMGACQPTTRTIQAYCSIQLFVQRCLLNLENPNIQVNTTLDADWLQWSWMGTFEGWYEARYTFLYPENLIVPEALPNQSSFFQDMQNDLTQGAVTVDIVKTAFGNYLESLDQIARLEVKGMWYDEPTGTLHVFARTYGGDPAIYYYRTLNVIQQWSPWELVTADISGDQIIPIVQNGRLYLYWPVYTQATNEDKKTQTQKGTTDSGNITSSSPPPNKYWQIQIAFSEYKNGKWTGKKVSKDYLSSETILTAGGNPIIFPEPSDFVFFALDVPQNKSSAYIDTLNSLMANNTMAIACYQPSNVILKITVTFFSSDPTFSESYQLTINPNNPSFHFQDLLDKINASILINGNSPNLTSNQTLNPLAGDPASLIQSMLNPLFPSGVSASVAPVTYSVSLPESLSILVQGGLNSFLLDPARGYATAIDLGNLGNYTKQINPIWFNNSNWDNMLATGAGSLEDHTGSPILSPSGNNGYANLLSLQMGLWAKYGYFTENKIDLNLLGVMMPFFYQDASCSFFVRQAFSAFGTWWYYRGMEGIFAAINGDPGELNTFFSNTGNLAMDNGPAYQFNNFYHPFANQFIKIFAQKGIESILTRPIQLTGDPLYQAYLEVLNNLIEQNPNYQVFNFNNSYSPSSSVITDPAIDFNYPVEQIDFGLFSSYGQYNWELFFHAVLMSAIRLSQNQQFEDADTWFKFIFNPMDTSSDFFPQKFWVTKPFFENLDASLSIDKLILAYEEDPSSVPLFWLSVLLWRNDPYDPHMLAQFRITPYMYTTFMKYLDNLIAWANFNYQQYTMESVNIAIQLYMLALECLGTKPEAISPLVGTPVCNYYQLELNLEVLAAFEGQDGYLSDPIVQFENILPPSPYGSPGGGGGGKKIQKLPGLYFCIPPNQVLLSYWDTIDTQLNKIRNCMNIKGQFQPLSPFPSVPGMGNMEGSNISDWGGILPNYRFAVMIQKATELCNEVKTLGTSLLSALEKQDNEGIALLRSTQEVSVQQSIDKVKQLQITDANFGLTNLQDYQNLINDKISYYSGLVQGGLLQLEQQAITLNQSSISQEEPIFEYTVLANTLKLIPDWHIGINGAFGSPSIVLALGGTALGGAADSYVSYLTHKAAASEKSASLANVNAGYTRRLAEWNFQLTQANDELTQVQSQIQAAQNKITMATQEEQTQQLLIQNAEDVNGFLLNKYTNQQLYSWMVTQVSNVYFQSYQLAYSFAKQAEICFRYELGITDTSYIKFGYWDSLHKGLLSGEGLMNSLKQMETDYYNLNVREYELTRQISLAQFDPVALLQLKSNRSCYINIPEELFDLDYPGHYFRRIKHIAVTLPGVVGPYTPVCLKMTLMNNSVRIDNTAGTANNYPRNTDSKGIPTNDSRFLDNVAAIQYIATSNGVNDNGLFELNLRDERYLPFERAGAISTWQLEFPSVYPQFDPQTITDLIIHFSYTSRDGGYTLQNVATQSIQSKLKSTMTAPGLVLMRGFSARRDFPTQWYKFLNPANPTDAQQLVMDITQRFPFFTNGLTIKISQVLLLADIPSGNSGSGALSNLYISGRKLSNVLLNFGPDPEFGTMLYSVTPCKDSPGIWKITNGTGQGTTPPSITGNDINDISVIFIYSLT